MNTPALLIEKLRFIYPSGYEALTDFDLRVEEGECVAVLGSNGAGKSTFLLHLNGILEATSLARFEVFGEQVRRKNLKSIRRQVGLVFQNPDDQLFCPTVYDDVAFGPRNMGSSESEVRAKVEASLKAVGMTGFETRSAFHLSLGQKKRVAIATVLSMDAKLLALDEPTSALDPRGRRETMELLESIEGTRLIITHDFELARRVCQRAILISNGKVVADGPPDEIIDNQQLLTEHGLI